MVEHNREKHRVEVSGLNTEIKQEKIKTSIAQEKLFKLLRNTERKQEMNSN